MRLSRTYEGLTRRKMYVAKSDQSAKEMDVHLSCKPTQPFIPFPYCLNLN